MYHYFGTFQLYEIARTHRLDSSSIGVCKINDRYFDCYVNLVDQESISRGEFDEVYITFLRADLVTPLIQIGDRYQVHLPDYENDDLSHLGGEILIHGDLWAEIERWGSRGEVKQVIVGNISWTIAEIVFEDGIRGWLRSQDVGLQEWEEIGTVLRFDEVVNVRIEELDKVERKIKFALISRVM
jgi:hypothetical protein